jgi:hypothetical protein
MKTNTYGIQPNWKPDPDVEQLRAAIKYSREHPGKFDYQASLNPYQCKFALYIDGLAENVDQSTPTPKQKRKTVECLEAIRVGLVTLDSFEHAGSAA